ncbi:hypothetical protein VPHD148_0156 [Vibrio phage D148]
MINEILAEKISVLGTVVSVLYLLAFPVIALIESLGVWLTDGRYKFRNPLMKLTALLMGYKHAPDMHKPWFKGAGGNPSAKRKDSVELFFPAFFCLFFLPGITAWGLHFWQFSAIAATAVALAFTARFALRIGHKLEIHVKKKEY